MKRVCTDKKIRWKLNLIIVFFFFTFNQGSSDPIRCDFTSLILDWNKISCLVLKIYWVFLWNVTTSLCKAPRLRPRYWVGIGRRISARGRGDDNRSRGVWETIVDKGIGSSWILGRGCETLGGDDIMYGSEISRFPDSVLATFAFAGLCRLRLNVMTTWTRMATRRRDAICNFVMNSVISR